MNMSINAARSAGGAGASQGAGAQSGSGVDGQIASLQQRKSQLQGQIAAKEAYAQQCYDAVAGPTQMGHLNGEIDNAKKKTGEVMAKWAMGGGTDGPGNSVDAMKAEVASIDEQIQGLQQQKQAEEQNKNQNGNKNGDQNSTQAKADELNNQLSNLRAEKGVAEAQRNYPKVREIQPKITDVESQLASIRGNNKVPATVG